MEISRYFSLERSTVSRDLKRLIDNELIAKSGFETRSTLNVTETGANLLEEIIPSWKLAHEESSEIMGKGLTTEIDKLVLRFRG